VTSFAAIATFALALQAAPAAPPPVAAPAVPAAAPDPEATAEAAAAAVDAPTPGDHSVPLFNSAALPHADTDPPMAPADYDAAIKSAFDAQQALYGPLDGGWVLTDRDGRALYSFEITDPGQKAGLAAGAWRDLARLAAIDGKGYFTGIDRRGERLVLRFREHPGWFAKVVVLKPAADGAWRGRLRAGLSLRPVVMKRS
jgi:hypothetical protein